MRNYADASLHFGTGLGMFAVGACAVIADATGLRAWSLGLAGVVLGLLYMGAAFVWVWRR